MLATITNIKIDKIACCVPKRQVSVLDYTADFFSEKEVNRTIKNTGFINLRIADDDVTTADLCYRAAVEVCGSNREDIDALIFVTQTPDYYLPATCHVLQSKLNLRNDIFCLDINEGCSGYVYGLYVASLLVSSKQCKKVLLLAGDTVSKLTSKDDKSNRCIFGDAGTATLVSENSSNKITFNFQTFGDRANVILMPNSRHKISDDDSRLHIDGLEIMGFALNEVSKNIFDLLTYNKLGINDIDLYVCHQANKFILSSLANKLGIDKKKLPFCAENIGNTSSASIPLAIADITNENLTTILCSGFGVGLSIGSCIADFSETKIVGVFEYE